MDRGMDRPMDRMNRPMDPSMDRAGPHARSRSASRGFPSRTTTGQGYHSLDRDRDGYGGDRDSFMPIDRPRERSLDRAGMEYGQPPGGYGGGPGTTAGYGRRERSLDRGRDPMLDPDDGLYTGRDMGPHRSTRLSPNPATLQRDSYINDLQEWKL